MSSPGTLHDTTSLITVLPVIANFLDGEMPLPLVINAAVLFGLIVYDVFRYCDSIVPMFCDAGL